MKTALRDRDIKTAVNHIANDKKEMYDYNFNLLADHLPEIEAEFHGIALVGICKTEWQDTPWSVNRRARGIHFMFCL